MLGHSTICYSAVPYSIAEQQSDDDDVHGHSDDESNCKRLIFRVARINTFYKLNTGCYLNRTRNAK